MLSTSNVARIPPIESSKNLLKALKFIGLLNVNIAFK